MARVRRRVAKNLPLAQKFFIFTATLVVWVVAVILAYDLRLENFDTSRAMLLCLVVVLVAGAIAQFTSRALGRPLGLLQAGITAVQNGELVPIEVSATSDEVEFLGTSFNKMIEALAASESENRRQMVELQAKREFLAKLSRELHKPAQEIVELLDRSLDRTQEQSEQDLQTAQRNAQSLLSMLGALTDPLSPVNPGRPMSQVAH
jgi:signal transduction histidine kinase